MEYKLTTKDLERIKSIALTEWKNKGQNDECNICRSYVEAFKAFLIMNKLDIIDGKIYEKTDIKKT